MSEPDNIRYLQQRLDTAAQRALENGGGPPYDGSMEARLTKLETRLDTILPTLATKADIEGVKSALADSKLDLVKILLPALALAVAILIFVVNRASPPQSTVQPAPIIINVPAQTAAPPPPSAKPKP